MNREDFASLVLWAQIIRRYGFIARDKTQWGRRDCEPRSFRFAPLPGSNPSACIPAARERARGREWGRRDLNPRSTDISGHSRFSRRSSTRPMISRPLGISVWIRHRASTSGVSRHSWLGHSPVARSMTKRPKAVSIRNKSQARYGNSSPIDEMEMVSKNG